MTEGSQLLSLRLLRQGGGFASLLFVATPAQAVHDGPRTPVPDEFCAASIPGSRSSGQQDYYFPTAQHTDAHRAVCRASSLLTRKTFLGKRCVIRNVTAISGTTWVGTADPAQDCFLEQADIWGGKEGLCLLLWGHECPNS